MSCNACAWAIGKGAGTIDPTIIHCIETTADVLVVCGFDLVAVSHLHNAAVAAVCVLN